MEVVSIALNEEHRNMQVNDAKNKKHAIQVQARTNAEEIEPSRKYASLNNFTIWKNNTSPEARILSPFRTPLNASTLFVLSSVIFW